MANNTRNNPPPKIINLAEVIRNKNERNKHSFVYKGNGESYYLMKGKKVSVKDFNKKFPIDYVYDAGKGDNKDKKKNWINDKKSY
jgi:hypothetical protein